MTEANVRRVMGFLLACIVVIVIYSFTKTEHADSKSTLSPVVRATFLERSRSIDLPYFEVRAQRNSLAEYSYSMVLDGELASTLKDERTESSVPTYGLLYTQIVNGGDFYLNDVWVAGLTRSTETQRWLWYRPVLIPLPSNLLKGDGQPNVVKVVQTTHEPYILIGRPYLGRLTELNIIYEVVLLLSTGLASATNLFCLVAGLFMLGAWVASPREGVFGLAGSVTMLWALLFTLALWQYMPISLHKVWRWMLFLCTGGVVALMSIFVFTFIEEPLTKNSRWSLLAYAGIAPLVYAIGGATTENFLDRFWTGSLLLVYVYACFRLTLYCIKTRKAPAIALLIQSVFCVVLAYHDYGVLTGVLATIFPAGLQWNWYLLFVQPIYLTHLGLPLLLIIMGYILLLKYQAHVEDVANANSNLQLRLNEREAELIYSHEQQKRFELEDATRNERDRIYQDVHDAIGSRLVTAVFSIRQGHCDIDLIESQLMDCLNDLRMVINSQNDDNSDIQSAVFNYCLLQETRLGGGGVLLRYESNDGVPINLAPQIHINVLRILQESITNSLKHSGANEILVSLHCDDFGLTLSISDNGNFESSEVVEGRNQLEVSSGRGLKGMVARATAIGGSLSFNQSEAGTHVSLHLQSFSK